MPKKYHSILITLAAVAVVGVGFVLMARNAGYTATQNTGPAVMSAAETSYDFGDISMAAGKASHRFTFTNSAGSPVEIKKIYTSCMCTQAMLFLGGKKFGPYGMPGHGIVPPVNQTLAAGSDGAIDIVFDPSAHGPAGIGKIQRSITIESSSGAPLVLQFSANVKP